MHNGRLTFRRHYMRTGICIFRNRMPVCSPPKVTITRMIQITSQNCNHGCTVATDGVKTKAALNNWLYEAKQWIRFQKHLREALIADDCDRKRRMRCVSLAGGAAATAADAISANGRVDIFCTQTPGSLGTMKICNNLCGAVMRPLQTPAAKAPRGLYRKNTGGALVRGPQTLHCNCNCNRACAALYLGGQKTHAEQIMCVNL
jgi:hypothetical protein